MSKEEILLAFVRLGIGHPAEVVAESIDWDAIQALATEQGLTAVVLDGIDWLKVHGEGSMVKLPPKTVMVQWIGEVLQNYEYRYELCRRAIAELAGFYNSHGFKMMVLKGYACSLDWPKPEHRPTGDIDIWHFGKQKEADEVLSHTEITDNTEKVAFGSKAQENLAQNHIEIDNSHHHHTVFYWRDFMVENHYDFINVHARRSNVKLERIFKELGADDTHYVDVYGERVYLPSPNLHALFLMRHMVAHFSSVSITLRQALDWAFFVEKHGREVDWKWLMGVLEGFHLTDFFDCINAICVEDLGFNFGGLAAYGLQLKVVDKELKARVLKDILHPEFSVSEPSKLLPRMAYKYRRWKGNAWKHRLCYNESLWSAFWSGVWAHLMKPGSI